ncbi:hypothetical protein FGE12_14890 [Aggregicoccus sp. 17bor-14]|nr:hypothetical protein [Simulacricoccus sp. 17bor-14]MRI89438.1 hypothetical protein [Aggregicoccus sp. 17bor-14]
MHRRHQVPILMLLAGVTVHAAGALVADALWNKGALHDLVTRQPSALFAYALATAFALTPLVAFASLHVLLQRLAHRFVPVRRMLQVGTVAFPLLALAAQVESWRWLASDAQAALLLLFLPIYAAVGAGVLMLLALLASVLLGEHHRPALRH